jgi:hypothetical protein
MRLKNEVKFMSEMNGKIRAYGRAERGVVETEIHHL